MKVPFKLAAVAIALGSSVGIAHADLDINGAVGLPLNPTAQIPAQDAARVQANYFDLGRVGGLRTSFYGINAAGQIAKGLEINGGVSRVDQVNHTNGVDIGAKYLITKESDPAGVRLAVGGGYSRVLAKDGYGYLVASKYLGTVSAGKTPVTGHLGVRYDRFDQIKSNKVSAFAGVEVPITSDGEWQAVGEIQSKNVEGPGSVVPYSASIRYRPKGQPFGASIGIARQGLTTRDGVFAQIGYTFGTK